MKATLEFNLPEESAEHKMAVHAAELYSTLDDIRQLCRTSLKHGHSYQTPEDVFEAIRALVNDCHAMNMD